MLDTFTHGVLSSSVIISHSSEALALYFYYSFCLASPSDFVSDVFANRHGFPAIIAALKPKMVPSNTPSTNTTTKSKKSKPTKAHLVQEIKFDLLLTRCSFMIELLSNTLVTVSPAWKTHDAGALSHSKGQSQALFVLATSLSSLGSGAVPAIQSLSLCILQARASDTGEADGGPEEAAGSLFSALAVLYAIGSMIGVSVPISDRNLYPDDS
jgi:hypothetical protein